MTLVTGGYTVGSNQPLNRARILWQFLTGTITAGGTGGALAANDFTNQRWTPGTGAQSWTLQTASAQSVDMCLIAAHNLTGKAITISTAATAGGSHTTRATLTPTDNSPIAVLFNNAGSPYSVREVRVALADGTGAVVGIIRFGVAMQMEQPFFGGHDPLRLNRETEAKQALSESGSWLARQVKRRGVSATYDWTHLTKTWYEGTFEPFAQTLPAQPFGIVGNPSKIGAADVGWCWTDGDPSPQFMGILDLMQVTLQVKGLWE